LFFLSLRALTLLSIIIKGDEGEIDVQEEDDQFQENEMEEEEGEITQEDTWTVISSYFEEKGLVRQQLDSFDTFIQNTMQELVDESPDLILQPEAQHRPGAGPLTQTRHVINFGQIYLSRPTMTESDGSTRQMLPNEARLRNMTYLVPPWWWWWWWWWWWCPPPPKKGEADLVGNVFCVRSQILCSPVC